MAGDIDPAINFYYHFDKKCDKISFGKE